MNKLQSSIPERQYIYITIIHYHINYQKYFICVHHFLVPACHFQVGETGPPTPWRLADRDGPIEPL